MICLQCASRLKGEKGSDESYAGLAVAIAATTSQGAHSLKITLDFRAKFFLHHSFRNFLLPPE